MLSSMNSAAMCCWGVRPLMLTTHVSRARALSSSSTATVTTTTSATAGPLSGLRVLDHTTALAGPYCTQILGDLGADVIKIEVPNTGDQSRGWGPPFVGEGSSRESVYFLGTNRNKRGITLNLANKKARDVLARLVASADVLVNNIPKQSTREKLGLDAATCHATNERLVHACISGFGNSGPFAGRPGYDLLAQGFTGTMHSTGNADDPPMRFPTPLADLSAGVYTALSIVGALYARDRPNSPTHGRGQCIDTSLLESQASWLSILASNYLVAGQKVTKVGNLHPSIVPYQPFATRTDYIIVAVGSERLWSSLLGALELKDTPIASDERFATNAERLRHRDVLVPLLQEQFMKATCDEWESRLVAAGIPCGPIYPIEKCLDHEHMRARGMVVQFEHAVAGAYQALGSPLHLSDTPVTYTRPAPMLGEHNYEVLKEVGLAATDIDRLDEDGAI